MPEDSLTYRSSGVDVEANLEANERIKSYVRRTFNERVLTPQGLFGGAISLDGPPASIRNPVLVGSLASGGRSRASFADRIIEACKSKLSSSVYPLVFLDYIASARLDPARAAEAVGAFSRLLAREPKIPIIGGETAEMPDVFREGGWEIVGALFGLREAAGSAGAFPPGAGAFLPGEGARLPGAGARLPVAEASLPAAGDSRPSALVFSMDGVGTKTKVGIKARHTAGLSLDLIHHSLNDILCQGAKGVAVLLYMGCHGRDEELLEPLLRSAREGCAANDLKILDLCVAEKPELYLPGEIDLCGAVAGVVETDRLIKGSGVRRGDRLLGLFSSGLHTNGYSLARKALLDRGGLRLEQVLPELERSLGEALLEPHRNYAPAVLPLLQDEVLGSAVRAIAHITGGGLKDNLARVLPDGLSAEIHLDRWQPPPIFTLIRRAGKIPLQDPVGKGMYESFNMGIGLVLIVAPELAGRVAELIAAAGHGVAVIGEVVEQRGSGAPSAGREERVRLLS
jgi:phosphoribosylformylglycinamidine cyclo-ligase